MKKLIAFRMKKQKVFKFSGLFFTAAFVILAAAMMAGTSRFLWDARPISESAGGLSAFTYETAGGGSGEAAFPHSLSHLAPNTPVTVYADIEPGRYESLLVKTVYTGLRLYADDILIYECGQPGSYPAWLLDPPTLLKIVSLPESAERLRFEYISPSQRSTMSLPEMAVGSDGELLAGLFAQNAALLIIAFLLLFGGLTLTAFFLLFLRSQPAGRPFLSLGLFAAAAGCWGLGECNAMAFIIPYPAVLYFMAMGGLASVMIPMLSYGLALISPRNPKPLRIMRGILRITLIAVLALQLFGVRSLSGSLLVIQIFDILGLLVFASVAAWESFRHKNRIARQFALPSLVLLTAAVLDYVNYALRFTNLLSLFYMTGMLIFAFMLGVIGMRQTREVMREAEAAKKLAQKIDFYHRMSHDILTPLTRVSTNVQMSGYAPETAPERLAEAQADIMLIAGMVNQALSDGKEGEKS